MRQALLRIAPAGVLWLAACTTPEASTASSASLTTDGQQVAEAETVWDYLSTKYDADGDGRVVAAEYDRGDETFGRLDRDGDGDVTAEDFAAREDRGSGMSPARMAPMILARCFQGDEDPALTRDEFRDQLRSLDADGDGLLQAAEADPAYADLRSMMDADFHAMLVSAADGNADGELSEFELLLLFDRSDEDADGALRSPGQGGRRRGGAGARRGSEDAGDAEAEGEPPPAAQGNVAPDFSLRPVSGTGDPVRLSAFQGDRPVALIFGSYT